MDLLFGLMAQSEPADPLECVNPCSLSHPTLAQGKMTLSVILFLTLYSLWSKTHQVPRDLTI